MFIVYRKNTSDVKNGMLKIKKKRKKHKNYRNAKTDPPGKILYTCAFLLKSTQEFRLYCSTYMKYEKQYIQCVNTS